MNAEKIKTHTTVDESLEAFSPFPTYHEIKSVKRNTWLRCITKKLNQVIS